MKALDKAKAFLDKNGWFIVIGLLLLIAIFLWFSFTKTRSQSGASDYEEKKKLYELRIKALESENKALAGSLVLRDSAIARTQRQDSMLIVLINGKNQTIYEIQQTRKTLNARVDKFTGDDLAKYFAELK